jgi:DNA polymerase sigma
MYPQASAYPPLTPLVLVLKVYLRSCGLGEVMNGGLSSFSLTNMALAHLMEELKVDNHGRAAGGAFRGVVQLMVT